MTRLAIIADIHGNALALEAVLEDVRARDIQSCINLGDVVSGPLWPAETMAMLAGRKMPTVRGNHDRWVAGDDPALRGSSDRFAHARLDADQRAWLGALPASLDIGDGIRAFHASPDDDNRYLVEEVFDRRLVRARPALIAARLRAVNARILLCAHSHLPHLIQLPDGPLILNPGSVGCPAYDDPGADQPHVSEAGSPHARYAILTMEGGRATVEMIALTYPWEQAAAQAAENGRPEWAHGLRTGFMPAAP